MKMDVTKSTGPAQKAGVGSPIMAAASAVPVIMATARYTRVFFMFYPPPKGV